MNARRTMLLALALTGSICAFAAGAAANTFTVAPLTLVTGPSPFAGCTVGAAPGSVLYPNAEEEPWIDVNPTNPNNLIAVWQQDRWNDGGAHGLATGVSHDGGLTWTETFPHFSTCAGGTAANGGAYDRASDPWVSFGPDGTAYQVSLSFNANDPTSAILASTSTDGGDLWSEPVTVLRDSGDRDSSFAFNDKESVTADATKAGYAYAVWDRFTSPGPYSRTSIEGLIHSQAFREPIWFSRTTDGGHTWEPARNIYDRSSQNGTIGSQILVGKNGDLLNFFDEFFVHKNSDDQRGESISVIRSTDQGLTWDKKSTVIAPSRERGAFDPDTGRPIRAEGGLPEVAIDRASGALYVVWQDAGFSGVDEIAFSMSTDNGHTWSTPIKVNQTPPERERRERPGVRRRRARDRGRYRRSDVLRLPQQHSGGRRPDGLLDRPLPRGLHVARELDEREPAHDLLVRHRAGAGGPRAVRLLPRRVRGADEHRQPFRPGLHRREQRRRREQHGPIRDVSRLS
jgi:hypothetical protein